MKTPKWLNEILNPFWRKVRGVRDTLQAALESDDQTMIEALLALASGLLERLADKLAEALLRRHGKANALDVLERMRRRIGVPPSLPSEPPLLAAARQSLDLTLARLPQLNESRLRALVESVADVTDDTWRKS